MTTRQIVELIQKRLKAIDHKKQFQFLFVQKSIDPFWQQVCVETYNDKTMDIGIYSKMYTVDIDKDDDGFYTSDVPVEIVRLPRVGEGVISINQTGSRGSDFKPITEIDFRLMTSQEVYRTGRDIYWRLKYDKIYYGESMTDNIAEAGVEMFICIPFSEYELTEEIPLPLDRTTALIEQVVNFLIGTPPTVTDNKNEY